MRLYLTNDVYFQVWDDIINQATRNVDVLKDPDAVKQLANILKVPTHSFPHDKQLLIRFDVTVQFLSIVYSVHKRFCCQINIETTCHFMLQQWALIKIFLSTLPKFHFRKRKLGTTSMSTKLFT